eukprot:scaffold67751_cov21-Tisochrysis_lutea.AAC.1
MAQRAPAAQKGWSLLLQQQGQASSCNTRSPCTHSGSKEWECVRFTWGGIAMVRLSGQTDAYRAFEQQVTGVGQRATHHVFMLPTLKCAILWNGMSSWNF